MEENNKQHEISFELDKAVASGTYSNLTIVTHSSSEFVLDFARSLPGFQKIQIASRIIMTPENAKRFFLILRDNIARYESMNGEIKLTGVQKNPMPPFGFGPNNVEA